MSKRLLLDAKLRIIVAEGFITDQALVPLISLVTRLTVGNNLNYQDRNPRQEEHVTEAAYAQHELQYEPNY